MKTVLLTGATGFVGRQIFKALTQADVRIIPVVRSGKESSFQQQPNVGRVVSSPDIFQESASWWVEKCNNVDVIIHSAWYAEPGEYLNSKKNIDCLIGSLTLAKSATVAGVERFIGVGTCFEYDLAAGVLSIGTPLNPSTPYASAKAALFMALSKWLPEASVKFAWCRLFYLYGEGEDDRRLMPYLRKKLAKGEAVELTSGRQIRDFMDVSEVGRKIAEIALSDLHGPINICSGVPITVRQLAEQIADEYGRRDLLKFGARAENAVDPPCVLGVPSAVIAERTS